MFFVFMDHLFLWSKTYLEPPEGLASRWEESIAPSMPFPLDAACGQKGFGSLPGGRQARDHALKSWWAPFGIPYFQENHCWPHLAADYICRRWDDGSPIG